MSTVIVATYTCDLCESVMKDVALLGQQLMRPTLTRIGAFEVCDSCMNGAVVNQTRRGKRTLVMKPREMARSSERRSSPAGAGDLNQDRK